MKISTNMSTITTTASSIMITTTAATIPATGEVVGITGGNEGVTVEKGDTVDSTGVVENGGGTTEEVWPGGLEVVEIVAIEGSWVSVKGGWVVVRSRPVTLMAVELLVISGGAVVVKGSIELSLSSPLPTVMTKDGVLVFSAAAAELAVVVMNGIISDKVVLVL